MGEGRRTRCNPWWIPRFVFGPTPEVEPRRLTLLGCVAIGMLYENYDLSLLNNSLMHIAESLRIAEPELGRFLALIRFSGLLGLLIIPVSDLMGRRRVFLFSIVGMSLGTFLTAFSRTPEQFILCQMVARGFMLTASAMAIVMITEEFPAKNRGWSIGMLGAAAVVGHAAGTILFAGIEWIPYGWRGLYFLGIIPIFRLPMFRRGIYETERFQLLTKFERNGESIFKAFGSWFGPYHVLARRFPQRFLCMAGVVLFSASGFAVGFSFIGYYLLAYRELEPWQYSALLIICGSLALPGTAFSGRLGDRIGRRPVGAAALVTFALCIWILFRGPDWMLFAIVFPLFFTLIAAHVTMMALSAELFPTALRGTSSGFVTILGTTGAGLGGLAVGYLTLVPGDLIAAIPILSLSTVVGAVLMLLLPETRARELEDICERKPEASARFEPVPATLKYPIQARMKRLS